jgi:glucose-6-phosphate 1-dehydrogenase
MDVIRGNPTFFLRRDELEAAWRWIEPILGHWASTEDRPHAYPAGSAGPDAADALLERAGHTWQELDR